MHMHLDVPSRRKQVSETVGRCVGGAFQYRTHQSVHWRVLGFVEKVSTLSQVFHPSWPGSLKVWQVPPPVSQAYLHLEISL